MKIAETNFKTDSFCNSLFYSKKLDQINDKNQYFPSIWNDTNNQSRIQQQKHPLAAQS